MKTQLVKDHPAETAGPLAMALAVLIGELFDADTTVVASLAIALSFVPAVVTWFVNMRRSKASA